MLMRSSLALALLLVAASAAAYEDLGLRPRWDDPARARESITMDARLARIDSLEARLSALDAPQARSVADSLLIQLVRLYRSSPLMKHRVRALEWSGALPESLRLPEQAWTFQRTFNPWDARERMEEWISSAPRKAEPQRWLGLFFLREGLRDPELFDSSLIAFDTATKCPDASLEDWLGVACVLVAQNRYADLAAIADRLLTLDDGRPGPWLLAAAAHEAAGLSGRAAGEFRTGLERMTPATRERFDFPHRYMVREDLSIYGPTLVERPEPPQLRGWWIRLIEAEALFSDPDQAVHSWETAPGQAYLLFGRPRLLRSFWYPSVEEVTAVPQLSPYSDLIARQMGGVSLGSGSELWVWLVNLRDDRAIPLVFQQFTRFARWKPSPVAEIEILGPLEEAGPIRLATSLPEPPQNAVIGLNLLATGFRTRSQEMRIEAWAAIHSDRAAGDWRVRLRLMSGAGVEIDRVERALGGSRSRDRLRALVATYPRRADGWVHGFGALVPAGRYLALVELLDANGQVLTARDQALRYDGGDPAADGLSMSELVLCDAYEEDVPLEGVPEEMVRFARVVVPNPEGELHPEQTSVAVYYELYGARVDSNGRTRLEVEYEVYPRRGFDPYVGGAGYADGSLVQPIMRAVFPEEHTGRSPGGVIVKGTRLEFESIEPGNYVLQVRVGDLHAGREASRSLTFRVPPPSGDSDSR